MAIGLILAALVLAVVELVRSRAQSLLAWGIVLLAAAHLYGTRLL